MDTTSRLGFLAQVEAERLGETQVTRIDNSLEQTQQDRQLVHFEIAGQLISVEVRNTFLEINSDETIINYLLEAIDLSR
jgi:hypothetical protein